jgi:HTH-type transcriptional regulator, sugar sensing transcriptional regulator
MDTEKVLQEIGLDKKEVKVYVTLLQLGQETAFRIASKSGLKRSTAYVILERLKEMGLVSSTKTKKVTLFSPVEPKKLHSLFKEKEVKLNEALPSLEALYNLRPQKPKVEMFEGIEGVKAVYYDAVTRLKKGEEVIVFSTIEHADEHLREPLKLWIRLLRQNNKARARDLTNDVPRAREFAKEMADIAERYPIRFIPKSMGQTHADFAIFGNKVALISARKEIFATVIEDEQIANSFRLFYEMAWKAGKPA